MLDLQPRVHLDEVELAVPVQELEGPRAAVADLAARRDASRPHRLAHLRVDTGSRRFLEHLLVPALHRAVALAEMHDVAVGVGEDLELDVPRFFKIFLDVDGIVAERRAGLGAGERHRVEQRRLRMDDAHPAPAATAGRLHDHRIADVAGNAQRLLRIVADRSVRSGDAWDARRAHRRDCGELVPHQPDRLRPRADEDEPALLDALGEVRVLREESVARVDGDGVGHLRRAHHRGNVEVALARSGGADADRFVGEPDVLQIPVGHGVHGHGADPELTAGPQDPQRDLTPVGDEDLGQHRSAPAIRPSRGRRPRNGMTILGGVRRTAVAGIMRRCRSRTAARRTPPDGRSPR